MLPPELSQQPKVSEEDEAKADQRDSILGQILTPEARERLNRVRLVKPERAAAVENMCIRQGMSGTLRDPIDEKQVKAMLEKVAESSGGAASKITFSRKKMDEDEDAW